MQRRKWSTVKWSTFLIGFHLKCVCVCMCVRIHTHMRACLHTCLDNREADQKYTVQLREGGPGLTCSLWIDRNWPYVE